MSAERPRWWLGPLVAALTLFVGVGAAEVLLRAFYPMPDPYAEFKVLVRRNFMPSWHSPGQRLPVRVVAGVPGMTSEYKMFSTNNLGLRGDSLIMPKPADEYRVFLVGGSTTENTYLDDSETLPRIVQDPLRTRPIDGRRVVVYGAAKSGDNSLDHVAAVAHLLIHLQPDMIVVFTGINDVSTSIWGRSYMNVIAADSVKITLGDALRYVATEFRVMRLAHRVLAPRSEQQRLEQVPYALDPARKAAIRASHPVSKVDLRLDPREYGENLTSLVGLARIHGAPIVFMTQATTWNSAVDPSAARWHYMTLRRGVNYHEVVLDREMERFNDTMRQVAARHDVPLVDLARALPKSTRYIYDDVHFNVKGADTAGTLLADLIAERFGPRDSTVAVAPSVRPPGPLGPVAASMPE